MDENLKKESEKLPKYEFLLSERLDNALKLAEISQNELSKMLEVHPTTVTNWKRVDKNKKGVPLTMLKKVANILDVDVEYLYMEEHNLPDLSYQKSMEKKRNFTSKHYTLFEYLKDKGYSIQYREEENEMLIIDDCGGKYYFDEKALKKFDAKVKARICYELLDNSIDKE